MNGIIMNDKVHATDKTNLEIKVSKETFTQMIQDGTLIEGATYKVTGYEDDIVINSKQVGYDNTTSQLAATNSQDAIDEITGKILKKFTETRNSSINSQIDLLEFGFTEANIDIISAVDLNGNILLPFIYGHRWFLKVYDMNMNLKPNTDIHFKITYQNIE